MSAYARNIKNLKDVKNLQTLKDLKDPKDAELEDSRPFAVLFLSKREKEREKEREGGRERERARARERERAIWARHKSDEPEFVSTNALINCFWQNEIYYKNVLLLLVSLEAGEWSILNVRL